MAGEIFMNSLDEIKHVREQMSSDLDPMRFEHTLGVAYTAACLAFIFNEDPLRAELTGLLHDCAKCHKNDELIKLCIEAGIVLTPQEIRSPQVIHAKYGRYLANKRFGINDEDILKAIEHHTTGSANMGILEKIVFVADYIEPLRDKTHDLKEIRKLAFRDLDECVYRILLAMVEHLNNTGKEVVKDTLDAFEWYKRERLL